MRLDKYLKVSRLIKRRTLAKEVCDQGRITINGKPAKASQLIQLGDELTIRFGQKLVTVRVDEIKESSRKEEASDMFTVVSETPIESSNHEDDA
jgi:ribosomal 50S subunit-recycling heat shock protein